MFFVKGRANWRLTRLFVLLAVVIVLLSVFGMAGFASEADIAEPECYQSGDLNGDGEFNTKDAIYALYSGFFGDEAYPISRDWDFDGNGKHNSRDAIELLYAFYGMSDKISKGMVHDYHDPVWSWSEDFTNATVTLTCHCGSTKELKAVATVSKGTCTGAGSAKVVISYDNKVFPAETTAPPTTAAPTTQAPTTKPQADDHDHDHDHDHDTDPGSVITAKERTRNMVVFFGTVAVLGVAAVLLRKKKRRR